MLVIMDSRASEAHIKKVMERIKELGYNAHPIPGRNRLAIGITGNKSIADSMYIEGLPGVIKVVAITKPYKLASRESKPDDTIVDVGGVKIGNGTVTLLVGPCAVETRDQTLRIAQKVADLGAHILRGGAYKPRTSPYAFQGLGERGLEILAEAREKTGLPFVTEVVDPATAPLVAQYADMLQIGTRNMQNFILLQEVGKLGKPVLMKRGMSATLDETLMSAEYIMVNGSHNVVICERGVRTFTSHSRNTLDVSVIPALRKVSHLPIIVDPSHSGGLRDSVIPLAFAGVGAGADGLLIDVHDDPENALVDGPQALLPEDFALLMKSLPKIVDALDKQILPPARFGKNKA